MANKSPNQGIEKRLLTPLGVVFSSDKPISEFLHTDSRLKKIQFIGVGPDHRESVFTADRNQNHCKSAPGG